MASQQVSSGPVHGAQVVGIAFVDQYYHILHQSPELVYRFYQDSSVLGRPEPDGEMTAVTTMQAINDKILSLDYGDLKAEIKTVDAQDSFNGGVIVLVTGCLTGKDNVKRKFTQSFFLAPQDKGYYVLNDIFRYVEETEPPETNHSPVNSITDSAPRAPLTPEPEPTSVQDRHLPEPTTPPSEEDLNDGEEVCDPSENGEASVVEEEVHVVETAVSNQGDGHPVIESTSLAQEEAPKKSYASIVKVMKESVASHPVYVPTTVRAAPAVTERQSHASLTPAPAPEALAPSNSNAPDSSSLQEAEADSHSIYIRSLPLNATAAQLEEEFKKFGPIKPGGVQVRSNKQQGFCFGFVEFESSSSMHSAIEASPIMIGGRQAFVEEKRATSRVGGRGRFPPARGGFRNDGPRGRGNFGGRGYVGRGDFGNRPEFSSRGRGSSGRGGESYQWVDQNGNGRAGRSGGMSSNAASS